MKRFLILAVFGMLLGSAAGCHCCDGLWRGSAYQQPCPSGVACPSSCSSCGAGAAVPAVGPAAPALAPAPTMVPAPAVGPAPAIGPAMAAPAP